MTDNTTILLDALAKKIPAPKVDASYGSKLIEIARGRMKDVDLGRLAGIGVAKQGDQNIQRLRTGKGAVLLAWRVREALVRDGANVPPIVLGADDDQARWIAVGEALRELAPAEFATELAAHEERVSTLRKVAAVRAATVTDLEATEDPALFRDYNERKTEPIRRDRSEDDRGQVYAPKPDGPKDKGKVDRSRKPPRSVGR